MKHFYNEFFRSKYPLININRGEKGKMGKLFSEIGVNAHDSDVEGL